MEISIFMIGLIFGFCSGVAISSFCRTSQDCEHERYICEQLEIRDKLIERQRQTIKSLKRGTK